MAAAVASPSPSPPISSSPGSLLSATSINSAASTPNPASPPPPPPAFKSDSDKSPVPPKSPASTHVRDLAEPSRSATSEQKRRHRLSTPVLGTSFEGIEDGTSETGVRRSAGGTGGGGGERSGGSSTATTTPAGSVNETGRRRRPSHRTRTLSLSFSPRDQAFTPTVVRPSQSTVVAATFPFPSASSTATPPASAPNVQALKSDGRTSPTGSTTSSRALDRTPSSASTASTTATRRPRPVRSSMSRIEPVRSNSTGLRVPTSQPMSTRVSTSSTEGGDSDQLEAKVVILGSQGVGKTSIITRCTTGHFRNSLSSTVGASLLTKKLTVDGTKVRFQIWDPAGQERFRSMAPLYYRGALAAILVYDVTDEASFEDIKIWLEELRKNMSDELIILVVGAKADLAGSFSTIPLAVAERKVALWLDELDHPPDEPTASSLYTPSSIASTGQSVPFPTFDPDSIVRRSPPSPRASSPSSPSRSRAQTLVAANSSSGHPPVSPPLGHSRSSTPTPSTALDRVRKMSNHASSRPAHTREPSLNSTTFRTQHRPHPGLPASATMPDLGMLGSTTSSSTASSTIIGPPPHSPSFQTLPHSSSSYLTASSSAHHHLDQFGMVRSTSTKLGLSLSSLGMSARRLSHDERTRKTWEDQVVERERGRRERELAEEKRISRIVDECPVKVVEVSAKDGFGIEEVFHSIAERLIVRKAEIEHARILRSRNSIMLHDAPPIDTSKPGWCAC
ncbi:hypothetical protein JCM10212_006854 [Sporobolomyces blumeae]